MARTEITGSQIKDYSVDLTVDVTGVLPISKGGTGSSTFALNNVLLGNGTGALQAVAPGTAGNVLTSNGTSWVSAPASGTAPDTHAAQSKTTPVDADEMPLVDSDASFGLKKLTWANLKATLGSWYDSADRTLTNKTLTDPKISAIKDATNGNIALNFNARTSAVNYLTADQAATGANPGLIAGGTDTNVGIGLRPKGTGYVWITADGGEGVARFGGILTPANYWAFVPSTSGNGQVLAYAVGADANININLVSKGTGTVQANGVDVVTVSGTSTLTNKTLTTPKIQDILNVNGGSGLGIYGNANATNFMAVSTTATGNPVYFSARSSVDSNVTMYISPKGSGALVFSNGQGNMFTASNAASSVNYLQLNGSATGQAVSVNAQGADSAVSLNLVTKGTGVVQANGVDVVTVSGTSTLTNKTLTSPKIETIRDTNNAAWASTQPGLNRAYISPNGKSGIEIANSTTSADYFRIFAADSAGPQLNAYSPVNTDVDMRLTTQGAGVVRVNGVPVLTTSGTATVTNKTISGASNTVTNLPASATPDASRLVVKTAVGGSGTENGANTWAKLVTLNPPVNDSCHLLLGITTGASFQPQSAIISVYAYAQQPSPNLPLVAIQIIGMPNGGYAFYQDGFKLVGNGYGQPVELWIKKSDQYTQFKVTEISQTAQAGTVTYNDGAAWQSTEPTGSAVNVRSTGVTVGGVPVVTTTATQTLTNKTISSGKFDIFKDVNGATLLGVSADTNPVSYLYVANSAASTPYIGSLGTGTDVNLGLTPKGAGAVNLYNSTGTKSTIQITGAATNMDLDLRSRGTGVVQANGVPVATTTGAQTLTNKTLTTPALTTPSINAIYDAGNNPAWAFTTTASAVNYIQSGAGAAGIGTSLSAAGSDTNISLNLFSKGTGVINIRSAQNGMVLSAVPVASGVNYFQMNNSVAGVQPTIQAVGSDTDISLVLQSKNTGSVRLASAQNGTHFQATGVASSVNYLQAVSAAAGYSPYFQAAGSDANINLNLTTKGTGIVQANGVAVLTRSVATVNTSVTLGGNANTDYVRFVGTGGSVTLPTAVGNTSRYTIKNVQDSLSTTILTTSSQTIDGAASLALSSNTSVDLVSDGSNWKVV